MAFKERKYRIEESHAFIETFIIEPTGTGPLTGLDFGVKDIIDIAGHKTSFGNPHWLESHPVAATNAICVDQLLSAGGRCVGKTHTSELVFNLHGENDFYGTPLNPKAPDRVPGGSSSGSASAVACELVDFAVGTDTGGSVRVPASNCGLFGIRPSHGLVPVAGVCPFAPSFDTMGVLANTPDVLLKAASVLLACEIPSHVEIGTIHLVKDAFDLCDPSVLKSLTEPVQVLKSLFPGKLRETTFSEIIGAPHSLREWYEEVYRPIQRAEIMSSLGSWIDDIKPVLGPRTHRKFEEARQVDRKKIGEAFYRKEHYFRRINSVLGARNFLCIPTTPAPAPIKASLSDDRIMGDYIARAHDLTTIACLGRMPEVTMPLAQVDGVPAGLSLIASFGRDDLLLRLVTEVVSLLK